MTWSPAEFYYAHSLAGLVATSEASGYPVSNILQPIDGTLWKATSTATQYITFDAGTGNTYSPDYLLIFNHNLFTAGATVVLQYSTDNFVADNHDIFTAVVPSSDKAFLKLFTTQAKRYWRLKISGATVAPWIAWCRWGPKTVLDYCDNLTPYDIDRKANVNVGDAGYVQGIHEKYVEYNLALSFIDATSTLTAKIDAWEAAIGLGLFGLAWDPGDHATDIRLVRRPEGAFSSPLKLGGAYRDVELYLVGRKE